MFCSCVTTAMRRVIRFAASLRLSRSLQANGFALLVPYGETKRNTRLKNLGYPTRYRHHQMHAVRTSITSRNISVVQFGLKGLCVGKTPASGQLLPSVHGISR